MCNKLNIARQQKPRYQWYFVSKNGAVLEHNKSTFYPQHGALEVEITVLFCEKKHRNQCVQQIENCDTATVQISVLFSKKK